jgi:hypothetical protein
MTPTASNSFTIGDTIVVPWRPERPVEVTPPCIRRSAGCGRRQSSPRAAAARSPMVGRSWRSTACTSPKGWVRHDDRNQITTLCGHVEEGVRQGGTWLCENCEQTFRDLVAAVERLTPRIIQRA